MNRTSARRVERSSFSTTSLRAPRVQGRRPRGRDQTVEPRKQLPAHPAWRRYGKHTAVAFEYDPRNSKANEVKHGIDFEQAEAL